MKFNNETKIGILVTVVVVALLVLTYLVGDFNFAEKGYEIKVYFENIDGVDINAPVLLNGLEVGLVKNIQIVYEPKTQMELTLWLRERAKLRQGAKAYVRTLGMFGEKYIGLTIGEQGQPFIAHGASITGEEPMDFERLLAKGEGIAENIQEISENINERLKVNSAAIDELIANLNKSSQNIASISANIDERLAVNKDHIDALMGHLSIAGKNLEELSADIKENPWKLLYKPKEKRKKSQ